MIRGDVWSWSGDEVRRLSPGDGSWMQASVHPDGDHAVFWGGRHDDRPRLWRSPTERSAPEPLTDAAFGARHGAYGALGDRIVFSATLASGPYAGVMADETAAGAPPAGGHWHLFTMAPDGSDIVQVTRGPHVDQRPSLSPDGTTIAFVSDRGRGLWLTGADGRGEPRPILADHFLYRPWWSLDGAGLYTFLITRERRQVGRVDLATSTFELLANDDRGNTHGPFVDPRGDRLIVHSDRDGRWGLYELPLDGSPMRALRPPGHEDRICGHGTRSNNGVVTFDEIAMTGL